MPAHVDPPIRWGVLGSGAIAAAFVADLTMVPDADVVAVGSRTVEAAHAFAAKFAIPHAHGSYADLVKDPDVDVVYVATPHVAHHRCAMAAIAAGKAVLVEKPFTLNASEAAELVAAARSQGTFLMEAMWTRFLPHVEQIRALVTGGRIGDARSLTAELGGVAPADMQHRLWAAELGGGALLDIGVYLVSFASMLFGTPRTIHASGHLGRTGVDGQTAVVLDYSGGQQACLLASIETTNANRANINGTAGRIEVEGPFFKPAEFRVVDLNDAFETMPNVDTGSGLRHQAVEVGRCLRSALLESPTMPLSESLQVMTTLDEIRRQIGLTYPSERAEPA
jgi:predicted dehydrogenase